MNTNYRLLEPNRELTKYIKAIWTFEGPNAKYFEMILSSGHANMRFCRKGNAQYYTNIDTKEFKKNYSEIDKSIVLNGDFALKSNAVFIGPHCNYYMATAEEEYEIICIEFTMLGLCKFFPEPVSKFSNKITSIEQIEDKAIEAFAEKILNMKYTKSCINQINKFFIERLSYKTINDETENLIEGLESHCMELLDNPQNEIFNVEHLSEKYFYKTNRQCQRIFTDKIGLSPRDFVSLCKLRHSSLTMLRNKDISLNDIAIINQYCDLAYMDSTYDKMIGYTATQAREKTDEYIRKDGLLIKEENENVSYCIWLDFA